MIRAFGFLWDEADSAGKQEMFTFNEETYNDQRINLKETFTDKDALKAILDYAAVENPYTYSRNPTTALEPTNAKIEGTNQGFGNAIKDIVTLDPEFRNIGFGTASTLAAQAAKPKTFYMDSFTESGATVRHGVHSTAIGDDGNTTRNYEKAINTGNGHNVIVHGHIYDEDGIGNSYRPDVPYANNTPINNAQIAQAVRDNPDYVEGTPICYASCWSGTTGSAQNLANELGVPVYAPTRPVAWDKNTNSWVQKDPNKPVITNNGLRDPLNPEIKPEWKMFHPDKQDVL